MASKIEVYGAIKHYAGAQGVIFYIQTYDPKKSTSDSPVVDSYNYDIPFEAWAKFKDSNVKITIEKAE